MVLNMISKTARTADSVPATFQVKLVDDGSGNLGFVHYTASAEDGSLILPSAPLVQSGALEASHIFKAGAGVLYDVSVMLVGGALAGFYYLMFFDAAIIPVDGAVAPIKVVPIITDGTFGNWEKSFIKPMKFSNGLCAALSSTGPYIKTLAANVAMFMGQVA